MSERLILILQVFLTYLNLLKSLIIKYFALLSQNIKFCERNTRVANTAQIIVNNDQKFARKHNCKINKPKIILE